MANFKAKDGKFGPDLDTLLFLIKMFEPTRCHTLFVC